MISRTISVVDIKSTLRVRVDFDSADNHAPIASFLRYRAHDDA